MRFSIEYEISGADTYANSFVFMALAMVLARTAALMAKSRKLTATPATATTSASDAAAAAK
ncbi:unnamed protein product [[Actinomadura] parvosata subsp. kistnae]|uniref:hypothetical protein n=1 Tax=[Actinomadura] parvosata TaxID=1955412 RepID=UPI000D2D57B7|nr:hypothetical protein [Nonomuraea sp. ATCC 55076]SPL98634.1 unnamed protein product [Actinomadura parvosata subsp. kistnae]